MKLSEFPLVSLCHWQPRRLKPDGKPDKPADRVEVFAQHMRNLHLDAYGDWNIRDVSKGSCCDGTVVATLSGKLGRAEMWNNGECYVIPNGGEPQQVSDVASACALAGIAERLPLTC
jgi:hypothetical protein